MNINNRMKVNDNIEKHWAVSFDSDFWGHRGRAKAGEEISVQQSCSWAGREWLIPAIYSCGKGLVIDICRSISREEMENFARKWHLIDENGREMDPPEELLAQIEREHPMNFQYHMEVSLDGRSLPADHGCGITYNPMEIAAGETMEIAEAQEDQDTCDPNRDSRPVIEHYRLDPDRIWIIQRHSFLWKADGTSRKPKYLKNLIITMKADPQEIRGQVFEASKVGDFYDFIHPVTQQTHHLEVTSFSPEIVDPNRLQMADMILPDHFYTMEYDLTPDIPRQQMRLLDARGGDTPRRKDKRREDHGSCSCGIIGGSDGPTVIFLAGNGKKNCIATSGLYFEAQKKLHWQMTFLHNPIDDLSWEILPG